MTCQLGGCLFFRGLHPHCGLNWLSPSVAGIGTYIAYPTSQESGLTSPFQLLISFSMVPSLFVDQPISDHHSSGNREVHGDASHLHVRVNDVSCRYPPSFVLLNSIQIFGTLSMGSRMACDILISVSLVYYLNKWRSGVRRYTFSIIPNILELILFHQQNRECNWQDHCLRCRRRRGYQVGA